MAPEGQWRKWTILAGRGFGKSRAGSGWVIEEARRDPEARIHLVARTAGDIHKVMLYGRSGIMSVSPPWFRPKHNPSKNLLVWPNGAQALTFSAEKPASLRGPECTKAWADELAAWRYPETWHMLLAGLRIGDNPQVMATTTPLPTALIKSLVKEAKDGHPTRITRGSTYDNRDNLAAGFLEDIVSQYKGTRYERQEIFGEILDDAQGALFSRARIDELREQQTPDELRSKFHKGFIESRGLYRIVVAVDPAFSVANEADETGIVVVGADKQGHAYVLEDLSGRYSLNEWARIVVQAYKDYDADRVIAEMNLNGAMVESTLRTIDKALSFRGVRAYKGKDLRAEPVASLYEQGKVHHVGALPTLEDQMCGWVPGVSKKSPDRLDALVYGVTDLLVDRSFGPQGGKAAPPQLGPDYDSRGLGGF